MSGAAPMYVLIGVVLITAIAACAWLVSLGKIDPSIFAAVVTGSVTGILALLNPQFPRPPAPPPS